MLRSTISIRSQAHPLSVKAQKNRGTGEANKHIITSTQTAMKTQQSTNNINETINNLQYVAPTVTSDEQSSTHNKQRQRHKVTLQGYSILPGFGNNEVLRHLPLETERLH